MNDLRLMRAALDARPLFLAACFAFGVANAAEVGTTAGSFDVGPDGNATYSVPIVVPPGIGGVSPKLAISYDSHGGNSPLGEGGSLSGLSTIARCSARLASDGYAHGTDFTANDRFCFDGQELIAVSGSYGAAGTEYRTEIESFSRVLSQGGSAGDPQSFKVWTKSGLIMEFGATSDSRIEAQGRTQALAWAVNKITDTVGNAMTVSYSENNATGEFFPLSVSYAISATIPYAKVVFGYVTRPDVTTGYTGGTLLTQSQLLKTVTTYANNNFINYVRQYTLAYDQNAHQGRSRLLSITECGSTGTCFPATTFGWQGATGLISWGDITSWNGPGVSTPVGNQCLSGDFNGDGLTDVWCETAPSSGTWDLSLSTGIGWTRSLIPGPGPNTPVSGQCFTGDINGDGLTDMWCEGAPGGGVWDVAVSTGTGWTRSNWSGPGPTHPISRQCMAGDINGDGLTDMWCEGAPGGAVWDVAISTGTGWSRSNWSGPGPNHPIGDQCFDGDFNGDGLADMWCETGPSTGTWDVALSTGAGWTRALISGPGPNTPVYAQCFTGDINGDGLIDMWCEGAPGGGVWDVALSTGTGWSRSNWSGPGPTHPISRQCLEGDLNGDGRADMWCEGAPAGGSWDISLSTGTGWSRSTWAGPAPNHPVGDQCLTGDLNGDGQSDMWCIPGPGYTNWAVGITTPRVRDLVTSVTNGLGAVVQADYKRLTDPSVYTRSSGAPYPDIDIRLPMNVVSEQRSSNGLGGFHRTTYQYSGARLNLLGRGLLGFAGQVSTDVTNGLVQTTTNRQDFPFIGMPTQVTTKLTDGRKVSEATTTYSDTVLGSGSSTRHFVFPQHLVARNYEINGTNPAVTTQVTDNVYGEPLAAFYGNVTSVTVSTYLGSTATGTAPFTTQNQDQYSNDTVNWFLGRLTNSTVTRTDVAGVSGTTGTRTSAFEYDSLTGLLSAETIEPFSTTLRVRTEYQRDAYGNIVQTTLKPVNLSNRVTTATFDGRGQFPTSTTNALLWSEQRVYNPGTGNVTRITDPNGLITTYQYDGFGRKTRETRPDGSWTQIDRPLCGNYGYYLYSDVTCRAPGAVFQVVTSQSTGAKSALISDVLGRTLVELHQAFDGSWIGAETKYDLLGRVASKAAPHVITDAGYPTSYAYDAVGRLTQQNAPVDQYTASGKYIYLTYSGLTVTQLDPLLHTTIRQNDALGRLKVVTDDSGQSTQYSYDAFDNLTRTIDAAGNQITMGYDLRGRKTSMSDPDMGGDVGRSWTYTYDSLGELISQTDANNQTVTMVYDSIGRVLSRTEAEGTTQWTYDTLRKGALTSVSGSGTYSRSYTYDGLSRPINVQYYIGGSSYNYAYDYDSQSRVIQVTYPTGFAVSYTYNAYGYQTDVHNSATSAVYWQGESQDNWGNWALFKYGNNVETSRYSDQASGDLTSVLANVVGHPVVQSLNYNWDMIGNITSRIDQNQGGLQESFSYDNLNRLTWTRVKVADTTSQKSVSYTDITLAYDSVGNIISKSNEGTYSYGAKPHAVTSVSGNNRTSPDAYTYDANGNTLSGGGRSIAWTSYNLPSSIVKGSSGSSFSYGPDRERVVQNSSLAGQPIETTVYVGGLYEYHQIGSKVAYKHYIQAGGRTIAIATAIDTKTAIAGNVSSLHYLHYDHRDSVDAVTNENGVLVERYSYDAFGKRRELNWLNDLSDAQLSVPHDTKWGFTSQEHLDNVALIHMNGRVYDPTLGRFTSADPFVQFAASTQGLNRYTYVNNNPLSFTDPSGFFLRGFRNWATKAVYNSPRGKEMRRNKGYRRFTDIVAAIGTYSTGYWGVLIAGAHSAFETAAMGGDSNQVFRAGVISSSSAYLSGELRASGLEVQIAGNAAIGGAAAYASGEKFWTGAASGAFSTLAGHYASHVPGGSLVRTAAAAVIGGTAAEIGGGKFENGAATAAFLQMTAEAADYYNNSVGHSANPIPGEDRPGQTTYRKNPDTGQQFPQDWSMDVVGKNEPLTGHFWADIDKQGSPFMKALNLVPIVSPTAAFHDWWLNSGTFKSNWGTMFPAAVLTGGALLGNVTRGWETNPMVWYELSRPRN